MAAGIGSRYGAGVKQLAAVGKNGELIIDFSIYDALKVGFDKIVFIIRKDIEEDFKEIIGNRISKIANVEYVFQEISGLPKGFAIPEGRTKPWGTGHAILSCKDIIDGPFAVINADDFYGRQAFENAYSFLSGNKSDGNKIRLCMVDFTLGKTIPSSGRVTRGICSFHEDGKLASIKETYNIERKDEGAYSADSDELIPLDSRASMNFWAFFPDIFGILEEHFIKFLSSLSDESKQEFLLPTIVDSLLKQGSAEVTALPSLDEWFGITYKEDAQAVRDSIAQLVAEGQYPEKLF